MRKLLAMLKKDENTISMGRFCAIVAFAMWVVDSTYLAARGMTWGHYNDFSTFCLGYAGLQLGNKTLETLGAKSKLGNTTTVHKD